MNAPTSMVNTVKVDSSDKENPSQYPSLGFIAGMMRLQQQEEEEDIDHLQSESRVRIRRKHIITEGNYKYSSRDSSLVYPFILIASKAFLR